MASVDEACREIVTKVDGAVACGLVDLGAAIVLGGYARSGSAQVIDAGMAAAAAKLLCCASPATMTGASVPMEREVHITSESYQHFAKTLSSGRAAVLLVTGRETNMGMGWAMLRTMLPAIELITG